MYDFSEADSILAKIRRQNGHAPEFAPMFPDMARGRIALTGLAGAGKKTLYNSLWGWSVLAPDNNHQNVFNLGVFALVSLPDHPHNADNHLLDLLNFDVVVYVLDATAGLRSEDFQWIARLRSASPPVMVVLNKANLVADSENLVADIKNKLALPVMVINAQEQADVHEQLLPGILRLCPQLGTVLAAEIIGLRQHVVNHFIRQAVMTSSRLQSDSQPSSDTKSLTEIQTQLVKQIAEIYGERFGDDHQRESVLIALCGSFVQNLTDELRRSTSGLGWLTSSMVAALTTWGIAQLAVLYYRQEEFQWKFWLGKWDKRK